MNDVEHDHPYDWDATTVALQDGRFFLVFNHYYHTPDETIRNSMGGFVVGRGTVQPGSFSLEQGQEFGFEGNWPDRPASVSANYGTRDDGERFFRGRITYPVQTPGVTPLARELSTNYNTLYGSAASLGDLRFNNQDHRSIQGAIWAPRAAKSDGSNAYKTPLHLVVSPDGILSSRSLPGNECRVSGALTPHPALKVFEATITFNSVACPYPGETLSGVAYQKDSLPTVDHPTPTRARFHLVASNGNRGIVFTQILEGAQVEGTPPAGH